MLDRIIRNSNINTEGNITTKSHQFIAYANDIALLVRTKEKLKLDRVVAEYMPTINEEKTKYMTTRKSREEKQKLIVKLQRTYVFEKVENFNYLGYKIAADYVEGQRKSG